MLLRTYLGSTLRAARVAQGRTLREVAKSARVSLGYLSEVERGQKEASSELLNAICTALDVNLAAILMDVAHQIKTSDAPVLSVVDEAAA
jgi:transcriptional regulator with XRE-family HTH domain